RPAAAGTRRPQPYHQYDSGRRAPAATTRTPPGYARNLRPGPLVVREHAVEELGVHVDPELFAQVGLDVGARVAGAEQLGGDHPGGVATRRIRGRRRRARSRLETIERVTQLGPLSA